MDKTKESNVAEFRYVKRVNKTGKPSQTYRNAIDYTVSANIEGNYTQGDKIIFTDILPYILSYVVMAFILQISSGILAEAQLSMLGLGPKTTEVPTLGLMMSWAQLYSAHMNGSWWAYFPVIFTIALISFSLNLMNTGMDQVFNPALRD